MTCPTGAASSCGGSIIARVNLPGPACIHHVIFQTPHCSGFMSWLCVFFFFFYQIFHFLAGMVVGGWYDEGKDEGGKRWEAFPAPCSLVPAEQTCCWTLPAAPGAQAPGIRALGCSPFVLKPPRKSCFQVATDSLSQFPWSPLLIPQPAQHVCAEQPSWFS